MATTTTIIKTQIQFRRATTAEWEQYKTVVPAAGEPCFDTDLGTLKIGNGVKTYEELDPIGSNGNVSVATDGKSIILENNVFKLVGFDAAETGAQPRKNAEGNIEWVVPSTETVEGLQITVAALQTDVDKLKEQMNGTGEDSVDAKITAKINKFATDITDDGVINSYQELITYVANHGGEAATMAADIANLQSLVGEDSVSEQISTAIGNIETSGEENVIETVKVGGTELEITDKTVTVPVGAGLTASDEITISEDGSLGIGTISFSKLVNDNDAILVLDGGVAG